MDNYILCGMQFGDEGKGSFIDYLAHKENIDCIVKYNGGSQASHTVVTPDGITHKFSQLGSGMFLEKCETYLTENMVVNLENLLNEIEVFSRKTYIHHMDILNRIRIHENCFLVTPYHKLLNKLRELSLGDNRRGSVGTGVSEVRYLASLPKQFPFEPELGLQVKDLNCIPATTNSLFALYNYVSEFYKNNEDAIRKNMPKEIEESLENELNFLLSPVSPHTITDNLIKSFIDLDLHYHTYKAYELSFRKTCKSAIFEGSQGLLIDKDYGIKPNTTYLDTTNNFALDISYYRDSVTKIGIAKAFTTRHGLGIFPTEDSELNNILYDENQEETYWNGKIRFGWFDAVLFRYAQKINQVDEVYLSSLDKLSNFNKLKICNEYIYTGTIDEKFKDLFEYNISDKITIKNIKRNDDNLFEYLNQCIPKYITATGWNCDISKAKNKSELPGNCIGYIALLQSLIDVPISVVSVGPTRENKVTLTI